mmetsp:Transcript_47874/g.152751  ORF Transcript_47874/g.152751 Transcript_47874/m.152751 type:complete len:412 (-) Transcript_47874:719-1954(-)
MTGRGEVCDHLVVTAGVTHGHDEAQPYLRTVGYLAEGHRQGRHEQVILGHPKRCRGNAQNSAGPRQQSDVMVIPPAPGVEGIVREVQCGIPDIQERVQRQECPSQTSMLHLEAVWCRRQRRRGQLCQALRLHIKCRGRAITWLWLESTLGPGSTGRLVQAEEVRDHWHNGCGVGHGVVHGDVQVGDLPLWQPRTITVAAWLSGCLAGALAAVDGEQENSDGGRLPEAPRPCAHPCRAAELRLAAVAEPLKVRLLGPGAGGLAARDRPAGYPRPRGHEALGRLQTEAAFAAAAGAKERAQGSHDRRCAVAKAGDSIIPSCAVGPRAEPSMPPHKRSACCTHRRLVRHLVKTDKPAYWRLPEPRDGEDCPAARLLRGLSAAACHSSGGRSRRGAPVPSLSSLAELLQLLEGAA